jgi:hypothetical protein
VIDLLKAVKKMEVQKAGCKINDTASNGWKGISEYA